MTDYAGLREALDQTCHALLIDDPDTIRALLAERDMLETEVLEQARLNGMGSEREARLMAERDALRDALWVATEHNALHFGETHNTVVQGRAALAQGEA